MVLKIKSLKKTNKTNKKKVLKCTVFNNKVIEFNKRLFYFSEFSIIITTRRGGLIKTIRNEKRL